MQTSRRLFTEAELQRRIFLEISEIILLFSVIFLYPNFATEIFSYLHEKKSFYWECFRKAGHACDMNIKRNILVNFGQFENEIPPPTKHHVILEFLECENVKNISKMALCAGTAHKKHKKYALFS